MDSYGSLVKGMLPEVTWDIYIGIWEDLFKKWFCNSLYTSSTYYRFLLFEHVKHKTYCKLMNCCCFNSFWFYLLYSKLYLRNSYTNFLLDVSAQSTTHDYSGDGQCDGRNSSSDSFYYECQHQHYLGQDDCRLKITIAQMRRMGHNGTGIFAYIWLRFMVNVGRYSIYMKHMGWVVRKSAKNRVGLWCFFSVFHGCVFPKPLLWVYIKIHGRDHKKQHCPQLFVASLNLFTCPPTAMCFATVRKML